MKSDRQIVYDDIIEFLAHGILALDRHPELRLIFVEQMKTAVLLHGGAVDGGRYFRRKNVRAVFEEIIGRAIAVYSAELLKRSPEQRSDFQAALNTSLRRVLGVIERMLLVRR